MTSVTEVIELLKAQVVEFPYDEGPLGPLPEPQRDAILNTHTEEYNVKS